MIYTKGGLPIYSKCYGMFCKTAFKEPELLAGLLSAIETIPQTIGGGLSLDVIKMGPTQMRFSKTTPSGHSIVIGLSEDNQEIAEKIFSAVSDILGKDEFANADWGLISKEIMAAFEEELLSNSLVNALHDHGGFADQCPLGDQCPIHTNAFASRRTIIWIAIKGKYAALKERMAQK